MHRVFGGRGRVFRVFAILFEIYNSIRKTFSFVSSLSLPFQQLGIHLHSDKTVIIT